MTEPEQPKQPKIDKQKEFFEAMNDRSLKKEFFDAIKKKPEDLTEIETRALIKRSPQLSDDERYKYRHILVWGNLTEVEKKRFERIYPERSGGGKLRIYFPDKDNVEEHYKKHFLRGRTVAKPVTRSAAAPAKSEVSPIKIAPKSVAKPALSPTNKPVEGDGK